MNSDRFQPLGGRRGHIGERLYARPAGIGEAVGAMAVAPLTEVTPADEAATVPAQAVGEVTTEPTVHLMESISF